MSAFALSPPDATLPPIARRSAVVIPPYRYELRRYWDETRPTLPVTLLNPSTADAFAEDATTRMLHRFAWRWGFGGYVLVNLYALQSTDPRGLLVHEEPIGPLNQSYVRGLLGAVGLTDWRWCLVGWGDGGAKVRAHSQLVSWFVNTADACKVEIRALGTTKSGAPWHPLLKSLDLVPKVWRPKA